jgi:hypothetical protein
VVRGHAVRAGRAAGERSAELRSPGDVELLVDMADVRLDGLDGHEQGLCDIAIAHSGSRHRRDAVLFPARRVTN